MLQALCWALRSKSEQNIKENSCPGILVIYLELNHINQFPSCDQYFKKKKKSRVLREFRIEGI